MKAPKNICYTKDEGAVDHSTVTDVVYQWREHNACLYKYCHERIKIAVRETERLKTQAAIIDTTWDTYLEPYLFFYSAVDHCSLADISSLAAFRIWLNRCLPTVNLLSIYNILNTHAFFFPVLNSWDLFPTVPCLHRCDILFTKSQTNRSVKVNMEC